MTNAPPPSSEPTSGATLGTRVAGRNSNTAEIPPSPHRSSPPPPPPSSRAGVSHVANADDVTRAATTGARAERAQRRVSVARVRAREMHHRSARGWTRGRREGEDARRNVEGERRDFESRRVGGAGDVERDESWREIPARCTRSPPTRRACAESSPFSQTSAAPSIAPSFRAGARTSPKRHASASAAAKPTPRTTTSSPRARRTPERQNGRARRARTRTPGARR